MAPEVPSPDVDLRPLTTSELIDRGFGLYRQHFAGLLLIAVLSQAAPFLLQVVINMLHLMPERGDVMIAPARVFANLGIMCALAGVTQIVVFCFKVVMTFYVVDAYLGKVPTFSKSFRGFAGRVLGSVWTCILNHIFYVLAFIFPVFALAGVEGWYLFSPPVSLGGFVLFALVTLVLAVVSLIPVLIVVMRLMVTVQVLAIERLLGWPCCKRSSQLVRFDPGLGFFYWGETRLSLLLLPLFVIGALTSSIVSIPSIIAQINETVRHGATPFATQSDAVVVGSQVLAYLVGALILPLYTIAVTLFYYDVRIRREGFDLEFLAKRLETAA